MNKRFIILLFSLCYISSYAYDFEENGLAFNILQNGTLSLTHIITGENWLSNNPVIAYKGDIVIPASVTHGGKKYKVTEIGKSAFRDCRELKSVVIPEGIRKIGPQAFSFVDIKKIHIPSTVTEIVPGAIFECCDLATITVSPNNRVYKSVGNCIYNKNMTTLILVSPTLKSYTIPASIKNIADYAFNFSTIEKLVIPPNVEYIGGRAFSPIDIKSIICKKVLKRLPGSKMLNPRDELPEWAIVPKNYYQESALFKKDKNGKPIRVAFLEADDFFNLE